MLAIIQIRAKDHNLSLGEVKPNEAGKDERISGGLAVDEGVEKLELNFPITAVWQGLVLWHRNDDRRLANCVRILGV